MPASTTPRLAGSALRLNRSDLMRLLEDEESGTDTNEFLDIPLENVETADSSGMTSSFLSKGRGNVLGFQTGGSPTVSYSGPSESIRELINTPAGSTSTAEDEDEGEDEDLQEFTGTVGGVSIEDIGGEGFGMMDYNTAIAAGYDPDSIESWVRENRDELFNIGPEAQETLNITDYTQTTPGYFDYSERGGPGFGMEDVNYLISQGAREEDIRTLAQQAPYVGEEAYERYGGSMLATPESVATVQAPADYPRYQARRPTTADAPGGFDYSAYGQAGFGYEDLQAAHDEGYSNEQIAALAASAPGGLVGPRVREYLSARGY